MKQLSFPFPFFDVFFDPTCFTTIWEDVDIRRRLYDVTLGAISDV